LTADLLEALPESYSVLHDLMIPRSTANIDHVVIGPTGIFVVETKNYEGSVSIRDGEAWVGNRRRPKLRGQVLDEAQIVKANLTDRQTYELAPDVHPLMCFQGNALDQPLWFEGVHLVRAEDLVAAITQRPVVLEASEIHKLADLAVKRLRPRGRKWAVAPVAAPLPPVVPRAVPRRRPTPSRTRSRGSARKRSGTGEELIKGVAVIAFLLFVFPKIIGSLGSSTESPAKFEVTNIEWSIEEKGTVAVSARVTNSGTSAASPTCKVRITQPTGPTFVKNEEPSNSLSDGETQKLTFGIRLPDSFGKPTGASVSCAAD
jgi:hypothetical protein